MFTIQTGGDTNLSVRLDTVLQAVELPAGITDLDTALSKVQRLRAKWKDRSDIVLMDVINTFISGNMLQRTRSQILLSSKDLQ